MWHCGTLSGSMTSSHAAWPGALEGNIMGETNARPRRKRVQVSLTPESAETLERIAKETGLTLSGVLQMAFSEWAQQRDASKGKEQPANGQLGI